MVFVGTPPTLQPLITKGQKSRTQICARETIPDQKLVVDSSGGVANVVIFLAKAPAGAAVPPPPTEPADFDNKGCHFIPHVLLMRVGQPVKILNDDFPLQHNTHTLAAANGRLQQHDSQGRQGIHLQQARTGAVRSEVRHPLPGCTAGIFRSTIPTRPSAGPNGEFEIKNRAGRRALVPRLARRGGRALSEPRPKGHDQARQDDDRRNQVRRQQLCRLAEVRARECPLVFEPRGTGRRGAGRLRRSVPRPGSS